MGVQTELTAADGHRLGAYRAGPADARAGLVVIQEIFGVNAHMRRVADQFAAVGYAVIAPALFDRAERGIELGYLPQDVQKGMELRSKITHEQAMMDIAAAAAALGVAKAGIVGYCWGGSLAWSGATETELFAAASGWYGGMIVKTKDAVPHCPVQLHFGETDHSIPLADVEALRAAQPNIPIYTYPAGHGFGCEDRASYSPECAALAQSRTLEFFAKYLLV